MSHDAPPKALQNPPVKINTSLAGKAWWRTLPRVLLPHHRAKPWGIPSHLVGLNWEIPINGKGSRGWTRFHLVESFNLTCTDKLRPGKTIWVFNIKYKIIHSSDCYRLKERMTWMSWDMRNYSNEAQYFTKGFFPPREFMFPRLPRHNKYLMHTSTAPA